MRQHFHPVAIFFFFFHRSGRNRLCDLRLRYPKPKDVIDVIRRVAQICLNLWLEYLEQ